MSGEGVVQRGQGGEGKRGGARGWGKRGGVTGSKVGGIYILMKFSTKQLEH